jgi:hypothetical protein
MADPVLPYTSLVWNVLEVSPDGADSNANPDIANATGTVVITPMVGYVTLTPPGGGAGQTLILKEARLRIRDGVLTGGDNGAAVRIFATYDAPNVAPAKTTWRVRYYLEGADSVIPEVYIEAKAGQTIDLSQAVGAVPQPGVIVLVSYEDRAKAEAAAASASAFSNSAAGSATQAAAAAQRLEARLAAEGSLVQPTYDVTYALARWRGGLGSRDTAACPIFGAGSSTTAGSLATSAANRYFDRFVAAVQAGYPLTSGAAQPSTKMAADTSATALGPGVQGVNFGRGSTTSADFISTTDVAKMVAQASASGIALAQYMVGSNDWSRGNTVAEFKSFLRDAVNYTLAQFAAAGKPVVVALIGTYGRIDSTVNPVNGRTAPQAPWPSYIAAMRELALENVANVAFIDLSAIYQANGVPASGSAYDPWDLISSVDDVHQTNRGHAFMASELVRLYSIPTPATVSSGGGGGTTPPTGPTLRVVTSDGFSGASTTTIAGRSTDAALGGLSTALSSPGGGAFRIDGAGYLQPGTTRAAVETFGLSLGVTGMRLQAIIRNLAGGGVWLDVRRDSLATTTVGTYRAAITTTGTVQLTKRVTNGGAQSLGSALSFASGSTWADWHTVWVDVVDLSDGTVALQCSLDGVAGPVYIDSTTTKITTNTTAAFTSTQNTTAYQLDSLIFSTYS